MSKRQVSKRHQRVAYELILADWRRSERCLSTLSFLTFFLPESSIIGSWVNELPLLLGRPAGSSGDVGVAAIAYHTLHQLLGRDRIGSRDAQSYFRSLALERIILLQD